MRKILLKRFLWLIVFDLAILFVGLIFNLIFGSLFRYVSSMALGIVYGVICGIIFGIGYCYAEADFVREYVRSTNKKVKYGKVFAWFLPTLVIIALFILLNVLLEPAVKAQFAAGVGGKREAQSARTVGSILNMIRFVPTITAVMLWLCTVFGYLAFRCPKCGGMLCYNVVEKYNYKDFSGENTRTKSYTETVGSIYVKGTNEKVGDITRDGYYTEKREYKGTSWQEKHKCIFCGREKITYNSHTTYGEWKS